MISTLRLTRHLRSASARLSSVRNSLVFPASSRLANFSASTKIASEPARLLLQKEYWNEYLSSGRGCEGLFHLIDQHGAKSISPEDIKVFLDNIGHKNCNPRAARLLNDLAADHKVDVQEFKSWLIIATKFEQTKNSITASYAASPQLGERFKPRKDQYAWNEDSMSQSVRRMQYAVRGQVVMRADELKAEGRDILFTNIGNPHAVGQKPITYYRQVLALCDLPAEIGVDHPDAEKIFPKDAIERARHLRAAIGPPGTGAYTGSQGVLEFRRDVAEFISERDGHPAYAGNVFLTNGASSAIDLVLTTLLASNKDAVMIPIPQYPIYSALISRLSGRQVGYYLDESIGWAVTPEELELRLNEAKEEGLHVKALAIINPGNPTGQVLRREDLEVICKFCAKNGIVLLADEVYQRNVYVQDKKFISAKKVALETEGCENLELISFHSTSKGLIGECGRRGGYMELHHIDPKVQSQIYKLASSGLCSGVAGQIMTSLMVKPPLPGDESYDRFASEEDEIFERLKKNAAVIVDGLNSIDGIECVKAEGAMYAFPKVTLPPKAIAAAEEQHISPDAMYALSLLEETGICVVPASGFGQAEGRVGFRTTFLPPEDKVLNAIGLFEKHHKDFCAKYS